MSKLSIAKQAVSASAHREAIVARIPRWRKVLYSMLIPVMALACAEVAVRVGAYFLYGRSPYFLFYGLRSAIGDTDPQGHTVVRDGYFKFPPSRMLHQYGLFRKPSPIQINSLGFRGPDFAATKPANVYRIICLGESSTFGFYARDEYTYPSLLARRFRETAPDGSEKAVEVVNAGIPHANSDNILAMIRGEIFDYTPDLLTIYAGYNDAAYMMDPSPLYKALTWIHAHFATYVALKTVVRTLGGPEMHSRWKTLAAGPDERYVERQIALHVERYERNLRAMATLARARGVRIVFIRQPVDTGWGNAESRRMTYVQKVEAARAQLRAGARIEDGETVLLMHRALTATLDAIAVEQGIPVVDNIAIVDAHPEYFASYVHLTEEGNAALAAALHGPIASLMARSPGGGRSIDVRHRRYRQR